jgi:hypothetical protein
VLETKLAELEVAERAFAELSLETDESNESIREPRIEHNNESQHDRAPKPEGLPLIPEMIIEALRHAHGLGAFGLKPAGITSFIKGRWWPSVTNAQISPIAWRMMKRGELEQHDSLYALPTSQRCRPSGTSQPADPDRPITVQILGPDVAA